MNPLKKSTATVIVVGPFLDDTDGKTAETSLTVASIDVDLYKHGASAVSTSITPAASASDNDMVHIANGYYSFELTTGNTDTEGRLLLTFNIAGALPVRWTGQVYDANAYDSLFGSDYLEVDLIQVGGTNATAAAGIPEVKVASLADGSITADTFAASVLSTDEELVQTLRDAVFNEPTGVPAANATFEEKISWLFTVLRNKVTVTASAMTVHDDSGAALFKKVLTDDGTTYTEAEAETP